MNKKSILMIVFVSLVGIFLLSSSITIVHAALGDQGLDILQQGDYYEYGTTITSTSKGQNIRTGEIHSYSMINSGETNVNITLVNKTTGMVQYYAQSSSGGYPGVILNTSTLELSFDYDDDDEDGLVERYDFEFGFVPGHSPSVIIAGTWENYTASLYSIILELEYAKGNLSAFDYSLEIDDTEQKISLEVEYQEEYYYWHVDHPIYNESVVYDVKRSCVLDYDNFVISRQEQVTQYSINRIANASYLEDNDKTIMLESYSQVLATRKGTEGGGIPGYELFTLVGLTTTAIFGLVYLVKRKRTSM
ncbi:MAG: hypothetical protein JW891_17560 [Candidatus Lokiarchaeota archaeon]|nr:hypothetical protein [Candidatus Lokiarchaeota archaeon]